VHLLLLQITRAGYWTSWPEAQSVALKVEQFVGGLGHVLVQHCAAAAERIHWPLLTQFHANQYPAMTCAEDFRYDMVEVSKQRVRAFYILQTLFWQLINAALGRRGLPAGHLVKDAHVTGGGGPQHSAFEHL
jgi:hypothetical protein